MGLAQLALGSSGRTVKELQQKLNQKGYNLAEDGIFGAKTQSAVKDYQKNNALAVDGIVGTNTWGSLLGTNTSTPTTPSPSAPTATAKPTVNPLPTAPQYDSTKWGDTAEGQAALKGYQDAQNAVNNHGNFQYANQAQLDAIMNSILNREKFSYNFNEDAFYQMYKDKYAEQGKMAMADTMGQAAAMTGGYGNSYAATAGNQAYQASLQQLNDVIPELYQMAYDRYNQEGQDLLNQYGLLESDYQRAYGEHNDKYNKLMDALGIARGDYYDGANMFHTEQSNQNSLKGQTFNDAMSIWQSNTDQAWKNAEWDESLRQRAEDLAYQKERDQVADSQWREQFDYAKERDKVADSQWQKQFDAAQSKATGGSGGSGGGSGSGNGGNASGNGGSNKTSGVSASIRAKLDGMKSNQAAEAYLESLEASKAIDHETALQLMAEYMDPNEVEVKNEDGSKSYSYSSMVKSTNGWKVVNNGGTNWLWGVDNNAIVEAPNGEQIRLDNLVDTLVSEGMKKSEAKDLVKKLQKNLKI